MAQFDMKFKSFLLNEDRAYLSQRLGDILSSLNDLEEDGKSMGTRQLLNGTQNVVSQIRRILHTSWSPSETKFLPPLQKIGVALMKAIDEKQDLTTVISSAGAELQQVTAKMGMPLNKLGTDADSQTPDAPPTVAPSQGKNPSTPKAAEKPVATPTEASASTEDSQLQP